jgi:hypothetical protein
MAAPIGEASENDKLEEFSTKIEVLHVRHSYAMEVDYWVYLFPAMNSLGAWLARRKQVCLTLFWLGSWNFSNKSTQEIELQILAGEVNNESDQS